MDLSLPLRQDHSGPAVARLFHRLLALVALDAWVSLAVQVRVLVGSRGLLPLQSALDAARAEGEPSFWELPTHLWLDASDATLVAGCWAGAALALCALAGVLPRSAMAASTLLYLGYATGCRMFLSFQWDNLLIECGALAVLLPRDRPSPWTHALFRFVLFKLYFESGIAKWQSYLGDWQDGSAMTFYYETAPIPTRLAWLAHHLPDGWHRIESWGALALELVVPFAVWGPRSARLLALASLTAFQIVNAATANYGFFVHLALALHVFLLDESDVARSWAWVHARLPLALPSRQFSIAAPPEARATRPARALAAGVVAVQLSVSLLQGFAAFADVDAWPAARQVSARWRLVNTYHLFGHITRERIEILFETSDGRAWTEHDLRWKPGDPMRAPPFVAPHQPRVDFRLWFDGLSWERGVSEYVRTMAVRLCTDPDAVQPLFADPLPPEPKAVRVSGWSYRFTSPADRARTGAWWTRSPAEQPRSIVCRPE